jgi:hypothetical protein
MGMQLIRTPATRSWIRPFLTLKVMVWPELVLPLNGTAFPALAGAATASRATAVSAVTVFFILETPFNEHSV